MEWLWPFQPRLGKPAPSLAAEAQPKPSRAIPLESPLHCTVPLPLVGNVRVQGLTLSQAQLWFTALFRKQLQRPDLQLKVVRPRPIRVALVGEVERPGIYSLTTSESTQTAGGPATLISGLPTVVDALQKGGGVTLNANLADVVIKRRMPGEPVTY